MADQVTGLDSLEDVAFETLLQERIAAKRRRQVDEHSESLLLWLALAPAWPRVYVEAGFPTAHGMVTGPAAVEAVERAVTAGLAQSGVNDADPTMPIYWMTQVQTDSVLGFFLAQPRGPERILSALTEAARAVRSASKKLPLPDDLARWCRLGEVGPQQHEMARLLDHEVDAAVTRAEKAQDTACPDARRWIETATPIATLFPGPLRVSLLRANRRFELFHRRAADKRHLANFLPRESQIADFRRLMSPGDGPWALHYVGSGGAGKTMLIRHITADLAATLGLATARIDFDHLNPDYPTREPALLLAALAEELRLYERSGHSGFDYFYSAVNTLQESVEATGGTGGVSETLERIAPVLSAFIDAIRKLEKRPLFILDTCEELAKLRPDGQIPDNVRVTFDILEKIQAAMPELRVVFSGRRPLASKGAGWRSREGLPERDYLRLHIVSGFTRDEALAFLGSFRERERTLDPAMFDDVLARSPATDVTFAQRFEVEDGSPLAGERYNPYDLSMFASLAAAGQLTSNACAHAYVKERIVTHLPAALVALVPSLVKVGTFDSGLIGELCVRLNVQQRPTLADELAKEHWIGRVNTAAVDNPMWTCDAIHRKRLLEYYADEESEALADADRALLAILPDLTVNRPWRNLSIAYFDTALQLLQRDVPRALTWWRGVEEKIAADCEWDWAQRMTAQLLASEEGSWEEAAEKVPDPLLRASILATHAAASARLGRHEDNSLWEAVGMTAMTAGGAADAVLRRAVAGIINTLQWSSDPPARVCERILEYLGGSFVEPGNTAELAAELAMLEGAVEVLERVPAEALTEPQSAASRLLLLLVERDLMISDLTTLHRVWLSFRGRLMALQGKAEGIEKLFQRSLESSSSAPVGGLLDWTPPEDLEARLKLEAVRCTALRFDVRKNLIDERFDPGESLDSDRLASAVLIARTASDRWVEHIRAQSVGKSRPARCNAHRLVPSYLSTSTELLAASGHVDEAMTLCRQAMKDAELHADVLMQNDLARLEARLICRFRLFENGDDLSPLLTAPGPNPAWVAEDSDLVLRHGALTAKITDPLAERLRCHRVRVDTHRGSRPQLPDWTFDEVCAALDAGEIEARHAVKWTTLARPDPVQGMRVIARAMIHEPGSGGEERNEAVQRVGRRRAAEIVLEECEFAAISGRLKNGDLLLLVAVWFAAANEPLGVLRANVLAVLAQRSPMTAGRIVSSIPAGLSLPAPDTVMSVIRSPRRLDQWMSELRGTSAGLRPWAIRSLAACLVVSGRMAAFTTNRLQRALYEVGTLSLGTDLNTMLNVRGPAAPSSWGIWSVVGVLFLAALLVGLLSGVAWGAAKVSSFQWVLGLVALTITALVGKKETREPTIVVVVLCAIWWGIYALANKIPGASIFGAPWSFANIASFNAIVGGLGFAAAQTKEILGWVKTLRVRLARRAMLRVPRGPMELQSILGSVPAKLDLHGDKPVDPALQYILLRNQLSDDTATTIDEWVKTARSRPLVTEIHIDDPSSAGICWEAMVDPALFSEDEQQVEPVAAYRTLAETKSMHVAARSWHIRIANFRPASGWWAWLPIDDDGFKYAERGEDSHIAHLLGQPVDVRGSLRLELGDTFDRRTELVRPDDFRTWPLLVFCVVQGRPNDATVRTATDRVVAAQLRRFGAEVFASGVPLVLVIPPLPAFLGQCVGEMIAGAVTQPRLTSRESVLSFVREIREFIRHATPDNTMAVEQAYDVCLYLDHVPDMRPRRWFWTG